MGLFGHKERHYFTLDKSLMKNVSGRWKPILSLSLPFLPLLYLPPYFSALEKLQWPCLSCVLSPEELEGRAKAQMCSRFWVERRCPPILWIGKNNLNCTHRNEHDLEFEGGVKMSFATALGFQEEWNSWTSSIPRRVKCDDWPLAASGID